MTDPVQNHTEVIVSGVYNDSDTEITLSTGHGALLPNPAAGNYNLPWFDFSNYPNAALDPNIEIVRVTAKTDDVITVIRNQEGSGASTKNTADTVYKMILAITAKTITDLQSEIDDDITTHTNLPDAHHNETHTIVSHDTTVTGAELNADHSKLAGIDTGAKDDQTGAEIKALYEAEADTNEFNDAEKTKLGTVDTDADVTGSNAPQAHEASHEALGSDELDFDQLADGTTYKKLLATERTKLTGIEASADVNNISDADATDLTDTGESNLHYHDTDRARANHTGTQAASTISDFDTEVENNTKVAGIEALADVTDAVNVASSIHGVDAKTTPIDADELGLIDSAAANVLKKLTWTNVKATLKTYFDTLYDAAGGLVAHAADTSTHGTTGAIVGTSDSQALSNKTFSDLVQITNGEMWIFKDGQSPRILIGDDGTYYGYLQWDSGNDYFRIETDGTNGLKIKGNYISNGNIFPGNFLTIGNGSTKLFEVNTSNNVEVVNSLTIGGALITATKTPASAGAAGIAGEYAWDASYIYVCTATNTWKRVAISTW